MAAPSKQSSRWGSFLQQAVAGVESRLDNILVGDDFQKPGALNKPALTPPEPEPTSQDLPRASLTSNYINDRLQERLARVIAAKNHAALKNDNYASSNSPSRVGSPATVGDSLRLSLDKASTDPGDLQDSTQSRKEEFQSTIESDGSNFTNRKAVEGPPGSISLNLCSEEPSLSTDLNLSDVLNRNVGPSQFISEAESADKNSGHFSNEPVRPQEESGLQVQFEQQISQKWLHEDPENSSAQRQEEIHGYIERIDALQAKLIYLSQESAESARKAAESVPPSSTERKLAEKNEQIALLMEEGQKLSKTELRHMTIIKKLRARITELEKERTETSRHFENVERDKATLLERLKSAEITEKQSSEKQKALTQAQKEIEALKAERDAKDITITGLKTQLSESISQSKASEAKLAQDLLEQEKCRVEELKNNLTSLGIEKELAASRAKARIEELQAMNEREAERARVVDVEMRAEQQALESKLEVLRARAEEASSGVIGDAQAKLLRQIETLQTQYSVARENWQGIEASLASRVSSLEKERDNALKSEMDIRRKSRETTLKSKRLEGDFEEVRSNIFSLREQLIERESQLDNLRERSEAAELALTESKRIFDQEKQAWKSETQQRIDEERIRWQEDLSRAESPIASYRGLTVDNQGSPNIQQARRIPARSATNEYQVVERHVNSRSSAQPMRSSGRATPQREEMVSPVTSSDTPSLHAEHDEYFENTFPPSPHDMTQDTLSISTVGAGPSVQLVERMSAAVRRLECEKVLMKEELTRLSEQRDQARAQVVALMRHFEARKALDERVHQLEEENENINARYQTTLEMLGEKSELVEELRADVQDVKDMYRELVERTVK